MKVQVTYRLRFSSEAGKFSDWNSIVKAASCHAAERGRSMHQIERYIEENLSGEMQKTASSFIAYLRAGNWTFYKDNSAYWKDKIYYWVQRNGECVCFIAIKDPDDPHHLWTVWSDDCKAYEDSSVAGEIKKFAWSHIDYCGNCGSCGGGKQKVIFGKTFENVCSCTFRVDNAQTRDLPFLKKIIDIRIKY